MANEEHVGMLEHGVNVWNKWRRDYPHISPDLSNLNRYYFDTLDLRGANLSLVNLSKSDLSNVDLSRTNLSYSNLSYSNLSEAILSKVNAFEANLIHSSLQGADLAMAELKLAHLSNADLLRANLFQANLQQATISGANFTETILRETNFSEAWCARTIFSSVDLSVAKNLHKVKHAYSSIIDVDTLIRSKRDIPIEFLEGCGIAQGIIENFPYFIEIPAIQYYSCFISYSSRDEEFANQLNDRMKREGLRVWFAPEEMKGGRKIHEQLYEAIRYYDKLILVLSEASMKSSWVQTEIKRARKHERDEKRRKLFPISLVPFEAIRDWELFDADEGRDLAQEIREYFIPDFSQWKNYDKFNAVFDRLLRDLRADEKV